MSVNDLGDCVEEIASEALFCCGALDGCRFHQDVSIRHHDEDAERHAYAYATARLNRTSSEHLREEVVEQIELLLDGAADGECPQCNYLASK